jgi:hypothetical protein
LLTLNRRRRPLAKYFFQRSTAEFLNNYAAPVKAESPPHRLLHLLSIVSSFEQPRREEQAQMILKLLDISWEVSHGDSFHNARRDRYVRHLLLVIHY